MEKSERGEGEQSESGESSDHIKVRGAFRERRVEWS